MSNRQPNFRVGQKVEYMKEIGRVVKVWTINPSNYRYTVKFRYRTEVLDEGKLKRA